VRDESPQAENPLETSLSPRASVLDRAGGEDHIGRVPTQESERAPRDATALPIPVVAGLPELLTRARELAARPSRTLLGVAGAPGSGKSTLASLLAEHLGDCAAVVAMDGFHLSRARLAELGLADRMGAIDTFDADGFITLVRHLRENDESTVYAPEFSRDREETLLDGVAVSPNVSLLIVEGNYLLVPDGRWGALRDLLDETWFCERDEDARVADLIRRHQQYGKTVDHAREWALGPDQRNAELVAGTRDLSDLIVHLVLEPRDLLVNTG
jgi:pantothenate kinase